MRIAVSDYDGTMKIDGELRGEVIAAIWKWRENGNRFGIATGRDLRMTLHETDRWSIPFDFLVCVNGAAVYDEKKKLLQILEIDEAVIPDLLQHPAAMASLHYQLLGADPIRLFIRGDSWFERMGIPFERVDFDTALAATGLGQISFAYIGPEECAEWTEALATDFGDRVAVHRNGSILDINRKGVNKATGVADMLKLMGWEAKEVIAIGDGGNDLEMIRAFHGVTVPNAIPEVRAAAKAVYSGVAEMLAKV